MMRIRFLFLLFCILMFIQGTRRGYSQHTLNNRNPYHLRLVQTVNDYRQQVSENPDKTMIDLAKTINGLVMDIRYATANNFTREVIYTSPGAFVRKPVADAIQKVQDSLKYYDLGLKIYDAYRPYAATIRFFQVYPDTNYVANPIKGSRHNRGCAVDLTLVERKSGKEIPMPTPFDDFSSKASLQYSNFPDTILANRKLLVGVMHHFGFIPLSTEWWHFDFVGWEKYPLMDLSFEELERLSN